MSGSDNENARGMENVNNGVDYASHAADVAQTAQPATLTPLEAAQQQVQTLTTLVTNLVQSISSPDRNQGNPLPRISRDGERIHNRDFRPSSFDVCPSATNERVLWLDNIKLSLSINGAGIKWHDVNKSILCRADFEDSESVPSLRTFREVDTVVPYSVVFSSSKESCLVNLVDDSNNSCLVPIPTRIWNALSAQVYGMLKPKINNALRAFYQNVSKLDGHALVCALRNDSATSIVKSPLERLEERAALIELPDLGSWTQVRGDLMQLIGDWDQAVRDGAVMAEHKLPMRTVKKIVCERFDDVLDGIAIHCECNPRLTISDMLAHCDIICKARVKALDRKRSGTTVLYSSSPKFQRGSGKGRSKGSSNGSSKGKGKGNGKGKQNAKWNNQNNYNNGWTNNRTKSWSNNSSNNNNNSWSNNSSGYRNNNWNRNNQNKGKGKGKSASASSSYFCTQDVHGNEVHLPPTTPFAAHLAAQHAQHAQAPSPQQDRSQPLADQQSFASMNSQVAGQVHNGAANRGQGSGSGMRDTGMHAHSHGVDSLDEFQEYNDFAEGQEHDWCRGDDDHHDQNHDSEEYDGEWDENEFY